jgi:hypothetical protein
VKQPLRVLARQPFLHLLGLTPTFLTAFLTVQGRCVVEALLDTVADTVIVVFGLDQLDRDVRLVVENTKSAFFALPRVTSLPRTPLVK